MPTEKYAMKIMLLSQYFWPEGNATSELLSGLAFALAQRGHLVSSVCGQASYRDRTRKVPKITEKNGVIVRRIWATKLRRRSTFGRVLNTVTFTLSASFHLLFKAKPSVIIAVTNPPTLPWVVRLINIFRGIPYILVIHDVYPDIAVALGKIDKDSLIEKSWKRLNKRSYQGAQAIVALGNDMADILKSQLNECDRGKIITIHNWADGEQIEPEFRSDHPLLEQWGISDKFIVQYSGNIGLFHEIQTVAEAAILLKDQPDIHFLFVGDGGQLGWLKNFVKEKKLKNFSFYAFQPKENLPLSLTACDLSLVTLKSEATGLCVPSKFYGILAAGKPVLGVMNDNSEIASAIRVHQCGEVIKPGDSPALAEIILALKNDPSKCRDYGLAARQALEDNYTLEQAVEKYARLLHEVLA